MWELYRVGPPDGPSRGPLPRVSRGAKGKIQKNKMAKKEDMMSALAGRKRHREILRYKLSLIHI